MKKEKLTLVNTPTHPLADNGPPIEKGKTIASDYAVTNNDEQTGFNAWEMLPLELWDKIFNLAVANDAKTLTSVALVCKQAKYFINENYTNTVQKGQNKKISEAFKLYQQHYAEEITQDGFREMALAEGFASILQAEQHVEELSAVEEDTHKARRLSKFGCQAGEGVFYLMIVGFSLSTVALAILIATDSVATSSLPSMTFTVELLSTITLVPLALWLGSVTTCVCLQAYRSGVQAETRDNSPYQLFLRRREQEQNLAAGENEETLRLLDNESADDTEDEEIHNIANMV